MSIMLIYYTLVLMLLHIFNIYSRCVCIVLHIHIRYTYTVYTYSMMYIVYGHINYSFVSKTGKQGKCLNVGSLLLTPSLRR